MKRQSSIEASTSRGYYFYAADPVNSIKKLSIKKRMLK